MAIARVPRKAEDYVEELQALVRSRFPEARFRLYKVGNNEYRLHAIAEFKSLFDILDLTSDRTTDILVDSGIYVGVTPMSPEEAELYGSGRD